MKVNELPEKYKTCDWLWNYESIGLTEEHIKRLNNAINILESLNEHTDVKYIKEIKDKLLEDAPIPKIEKFNIDAFIEKACEWLKDNIYHRVYECGDRLGFPTAEFIDEFRKYMED